MRKWIALLVCLLFLCNGCSVLKEEKKIQEISLLPQQLEQTGYLTIYPILYYIDETTGKIMSTSTKLQIEEWIQSPVLIVQALLSSQIDLGFGYIGSKIHVEDVELTSGIANVYLQSDISMSDRQRYFLSVLIANTLIENCDVNYVNVEISGMPASIMGMPIGLLGKNEGSLPELYQQQRSMIEQLEGEIYNANIGLYFMEETTGTLLAEVRSVNVNYAGQREMIANVLWQQAKGAKYETTYASPLNEVALSQILGQCSEEELGKYFSYEEGILTVWQADMLFSCDREEMRGMSMAAVYDTLRGILPKLKSLCCYWQDEVMVMQSGEAEKYLGKEIRIYLPNEDMTSIQQVKRIVHAEEALDWNTYIRLIGEGPINGDPESVVSVFPGGLSEEDILSFEVSGDCAVLNFSENFIYSMERLTAQGQILMIYSIVNTICSVGPIKTLQFLVNGEYVQSVRGGNLSLISPLLPSPGLVKQ